MKDLFGGPDIPDPAPEARRGRPLPPPVLGTSQNFVPPPIPPDPIPDPPRAKRRGDAEALAFLAGRTPQQVQRDLEQMFQAHPYRAARLRRKIIRTTKRAT